VTDVLEILREARASLLDDEREFVFHDWTKCACGHIYAATYGHRAGRPDDVAAAYSDTPYADVIVAVARLLGWSGMKEYLDEEEGSGWEDTEAAQAAEWVSLAVANARGGYGTVYRRHAVIMIDRAIAEIEAGLDGPSRTVIVEPIRETEAPPEPLREEPMPERESEPEREREPVPA